MPYKDTEKHREACRRYQAAKRAANPEAARAAVRKWRKEQKEKGIVYAVSDEQRLENRLKARRHRRRKGVPEAARMSDPSHVVVPKYPTTREQVEARYEKQKLHPKRAEWALRSRLAKYGITKEDYDSLLSVVPGCGVCGALPRKPYELHVDHDHRTGRIRGLLCINCNVGLGNLNDNPARLQAAIEYLGA